MKKIHLLASTTCPDDASPGGILATAIRYLANADRTATGATLIMPDGTVRYLSRLEAERFVNGPQSGEAKQ